jgi:hypothetical protein
VVGVIGAHKICEPVRPIGGRESRGGEAQRVGSTRGRAAGEVVLDAGVGIAARR